MLAKRIIPCLDVKDGRVVKGRKFKNLKEQGDPAELAERYEVEGADEITFLDVSATTEGRLALLDAVKRTAETLFIPLTVGGGIRSVKEVEALFKNGADKVSINTAAVELPGMVRKLSNEFGAQSIVIAIDVRREGKNWRVYTRAGSKSTALYADAWAEKAETEGAGEILLTSIDSDGTRQGFDLNLLESVCSKVSVPVIASGGAGKKKDFLDALKIADAALAASLFHSSALSITSLKKYLAENGVVVRL